MLVRRVVGNQVNQDLQYREKRIITWNKKKQKNFNIETDQNHLKTELMQKLSKQLPVVKREMKANMY